MGIGNELRPLMTGGGAWYLYVVAVYSYVGISSLTNYISCDDLCTPVL